jgi:hypothetical protein
MKPREDYTLEWIALRDLKPGPIRHLALTQQQLERIARIHAVFAEFSSSPLEEMVENMQREINPDAEIAVWAAMARVHTAFCGQRELTHEARFEVYQLLLWRSVSSRAIALDRARLKSLGREDAEKVMDLWERG